MKRFLLFLILISFFIKVYPLDIKKNTEVFFPQPFMFSVHDLGWMTGTNEGDIEGSNGPYRAGVDREFDVNDYMALVNIAREAGTRIRGLFVTCELDRLNVLQNYPTTTPAREKWDNSKHISKKQFDIIGFVMENSNYLEMGLHGVCHGYWTEDGKMHPEWCRSKAEPWPLKSVQNHILAMKRILAQYGISEEHGHSFPESFDAGNNSYYWNPSPGDDTYSLGQLLSEEGCKYVSNDLSSYPSELNPPKGANAGGFDNGIMVLCKGGGGVTWYKYASLPEESADKQDCNMIRLHFPNFLAQDQFLQQEVNDKFVAYCRNTQALPERYVAKNTEQFYSQWLYQQYSKITFQDNNKILIDNQNMPDVYYKHGFISNLVLKIKLEPEEHVEYADINGNPIAGYYEDQGFGFLYLPPLEKEKYVVNFKTGAKTLMPHIYNDETYNIYQFSHKEGEETSIQIRLYGTQKIKLRNVTTKLPKIINSVDENIKIENIKYNKIENELQITVRGQDIQGETGIIYIGY